MLNYISASPQTKWNNWAARGRLRLAGSNRQLVLCVSFRALTYYREEYNNEVEHVPAELKVVEPKSNQTNNSLDDKYAGEYVVEISCWPDQAITSRKTFNSMMYDMALINILKETSIRGEHQTL